MDKKTRITILGLVFILSGLFFWSAINSALYPSKAQSAVNFRVFFRDKTMECNRNGLCLAYLYGSSDAGLKIAGVQGSMTYSPNLEPLGLIQDTTCAADSFKLDKTIDFKKTTLPNGENAVSFSLGTFKADAELVEGNHCIAAVILQPKNVTAVPDQGKIALTDSSMWKAGGTGTITVGADTDPVVVTINDTAPIPSITPPPPGGGNPPTGTCARQAQGDCSCDDKVDLLDWDMLRAALNGEGPACDVNSDGATNSLDLSIWLQNNDLLSSRIGGPTSTVPQPQTSPTIAVSPTPTPGSNADVTPGVSPTPRPTLPAGVTPTATPTPPANDTGSSPTPTP